MNALPDIYKILVSVLYEEEFQLFLDLQTEKGLSEEAAFAWASIRLTAENDNFIFWP